MTIKWTKGFICDLFVRQVSAYGFTYQRKEADDEQGQGDLRGVYA
jgi:hypothetical protein